MKFAMTAIPELSASEASSRLNEFKIIDVRRPDEFNGELGHIKGAQLVTLESDLERTLPNLSKSEAYLFVCRSGARSGKATQMALSLGIAKAFNMTGGMIAWNAQGFSVDRS